MRICVHLPAPRGDAFGVPELVTIAAAVEARGLHAVCTSDHPFPVVENGGPGHNALDPFVVLSHVSAATVRVRLLFSLIVVPYRNPFLTASMLATLDSGSGGRVIAGLGAGYLRPEFDALGARYAGRAGQVEEGVEAMRAAWTGEPVDLEGDGWAARGNRGRPVPTAGPRLPLWRGGNGPRAIAHAARACDGWMPFEASDAVAGMTATEPATLGTLTGQVRRFRELREEAGVGDPGEVCFGRTHPRWLDQEARGVEDVGRLAECGVTWIETGLRGRTVAEQLEGVERLAAVAVAAGVELETDKSQKEE